MNKAVMLSIRPEWCAMIASGEKTVEVRKTRPKIEPPFKCFIYETQAESDAPWVDEDGHFIYKGRGAVIGEFVCDHVIPIYNDTLLSADIPDELMLENLSPCLTDREIKEYLGDRSRGYSWHISDFVIYDEPKSLYEFHFPPERYCEKQLCGGCPYDQVTNEYGEYAFDCEWKRPLKRPPQSWCYVKESTT